MKKTRPHRNRAFTMTELLVSLAITGLISLGAYRFATHSMLASFESRSENAMTQQGRLLQREITRQLRTLGYNPNLVAYDPTCMLGSGCDNESWKRRVGITRAAVSRLEFTADLPDSSVMPAVSDSEVNPNEQFAFWIADISGSLVDPDNIGLHKDFTSETDPDAKEPCTEKLGVKWSQTFTLYGRTKQAGDSSVPTVPAALATNVLCFEVRYFRVGVTDLVTTTAEPTWIRECNVSHNCTTTSGSDRENLAPGPGEIGFAAGPPEKAYYESLRDGIQRIQIGLVLKRADDKMKKTSDIRKEKIIIDVRIPNRPWLSSMLPNPLPSSTAGL